MKPAREDLLALIDGLLSDALGERYGPVWAKVLRHDDREREALLVDSRGVTRTFSLTALSRPMPGPLGEVNRAIRSGQLIGEAFRNRGFAIRKNVLDVFVVEIPPWLRSSFKVKGRYAWSRIFEFHARKETSPPYLYGTLCEVFTPDFRSPLVKPGDLARVGAATRELLARGLSRENTWLQIGRFNGWSAVRDRFAEARIATLPRLFAFRRRVEEVLASRGDS
jgi:hypothetical protein